MKNMTGKEFGNYKIWRRNMKNMTGIVAEELNDLTKPLEQMLEISGHLMLELESGPELREAKNKVNLLRLKIRSYAEKLHGVVSANRNLSAMIKSYRDKQQLPVFYITGAPNAMYPIKILRTYKEFHGKQASQQEKECGVNNDLTSDHRRYIHYIDHALCSLEQKNREEENEV